MLRGDQVSPELRWRDEEGVHRSQGRPRPSPREQLGAERFAGLVGAGSPWRMEPGWRGDGALSQRRLSRGRARFRRPARLSAGRDRWLALVARRLGREPATRGPIGGWLGRHARQVSGSPRRPAPGAVRRASPRRRSSPARSPTAARSSAARPPTAAETRAREARELQRQKAWRDQASRALNAMKAEDGTGPVNAERPRGRRSRPAAARRRGGPRRRDGARARAARRCRRCASCRRASAASGSSRRSATCSCRSSSPATWTRRTS